MRPINLKMSAFGPFAGTVELNMDLLGKDGLYLITGDTGAGKTTIFDAICYALYGESSGQTRESSMFRSKYATDDVATEVCLEFEHRDKIYKIERSPRQIRPKKRGEGTTEEDPKANIFLPDGKVVTKPDLVTKKVQEILGIDVEQFKQIVMLAQGEFLKLLLAGTNERQEIFRKIFYTDKYKFFQEEIAREYSEVEDKYKQTKTSIDQYRNGIQIADDSSYADEYQKVVSEELILADTLQLLSDIIDEDNAEKKQYEEKSEVITKKIEEITTEIGGLDAKINSYDGEYEKKEDSNRQLKEAEESLKISEENLEKYKEKKERLIGEKTEAKTELSELEDVDTQTEKYLNAKKELDRELEDHLTFKEEIADLERLEDELSKSKDEYIKAENEYREKLDVYNALDRDYRAGQAGVLAAELEEGKPCPVCGSTSHPNPAKFDKKIPTESQLKKAKEESETAHENVNNKSSASAEINGRYNQSYVQIKKKSEQLLGEFYEQDLAGRLETEINKIRENIDSTDKQLIEIQRSKELKIELEDKLTKLEEDLSDTEEKLHKEEVEFLGLSKDVDRLKKDCEKQEKEIARIDKEISEYRKQLQDLEKLRDERQAELKSVQSDINDVVSRVSANQKTRDNINNLATEITKLEKKKVSLEQLEKTAKGKITGREKIMLETYVQMTFFDRIISRANVRFLQMTGGQYELRRSEVADDKRGQHGLNLSVKDFYNSTIRSVKTLSGGESFKASLSLALGLSEEIQENAGGIKIDTLFVDEGFGSLDPESLQQAYNALAQLTESSRLVGIISHVEALAELIDDKQIVVTKQREGGSKAEIVVQ